MPSCSACGAFIDESGKWAPAKHLLQTSNERDGAVRKREELRWAIREAETLLVEALKTNSVTAIERALARLRSVL